MFVKDRPKGLPQGTTNRQPNRQPPLTANHQPPPTVANRQQQPTANRHQPPITNHQPPPITTDRHQPPGASCQPPIATNHARGIFWENFVTEHFFFPVTDRPGRKVLGGRGIGRHGAGGRGLGGVGRGSRAVGGHGLVYTPSGPAFPRPPSMHIAARGQAHTPTQWCLYARCRPKLPPPSFSQCVKPLLSRAATHKERASRQHLWWQPGRWLRTSTALGRRYRGGR